MIRHMSNGRFGSGTKRAHAPRGHARSAPVPPKVALHRSEEGQGGLEYMLVLGVAAVAMVVALLAFDTVVAQILGHICPL